MCEKRFGYALFSVENFSFGVGGKSFEKLHPQSQSPIFAQKAHKGSQRVIVYVEIKLTLT